jgi:hypothetical protein
LSKLLRTACEECSFSVKITVIWDVLSCSLVDIHQCFRQMSCLHLQDRRVSCMSYFSILKMESVDSSEMLVSNYQTTWHHSPEDSNLHRQCHANLKLHKKDVRSGTYMQRKMNQPHTSYVIVRP